MILKSRQKGFTTMIQGEFFLDCMKEQNINALTLSYKTEDTAKVLSKCKYFVDRITNDPDINIPIDIKYDNKSTLYFPQTNSTMSILTAGSKVGGRGDTINRLHCTEIAFWQKVGLRTVPEFMNGLLEAVPKVGSKVVLESTANGIGGYFYDECKNPFLFKKHFYPWFFDDEYQLTEQEIQRFFPEGYTPSKEFMTAEAGVLHNLNRNQMAWRDWKIRGKRGRLDLFLQEYPEDENSCFRESAQSVFRSDSLILSGNFEQVGTPNNSYLICVDPAEGNPNSDDSAIVVWNLTTSTICKTLKGKWTTDLTGQKAVNEAKNFNNGKIVVERNNHGHAVLTTINRVLNYYNLFIFTDGKYGWVTSSGNKQSCIDELEEAIRNKQVHIASQDFLDQCSEMRYDEKDVIISSNPKHHYDLVMAGAIGWQARKNKGVRMLNRIR